MFVLAAVLAMLDALMTDFDVNPVTFVAILVTGAALLAVDVPGLGR